MKEEIIIAAVSALIGGLVTYLFTILSDKRKEKREDRLEEKKQNREAFQNRPEMTIVEYKDYISRVGYGVKQPANIDVFVAHISKTSIVGDKRHSSVLTFYEDKSLNIDEWCCVLYTLKNTGKTDISTFYLFSNFQQTTCIFPSSEARQYADANMLNYSYCYDKKIHAGETVSVKICYHKECIVPGLFSAPMSIGMVDDNGKYWTQPLFSPQDRIYDSRRSSLAEFNEMIRTTTAEECFKKPWLW